MIAIKNFTWFKVLQKNQIGCGHKEQVQETFVHGVVGENIFNERRKHKVWRRFTDKKKGYAKALKWKRFGGTLESRGSSSET